jgi:hypothetical protein
MVLWLILLLLLLVCWFYFYFFYADEAEISRPALSAFYEEEVCKLREQNVALMKMARPPADSFMLPPDKPLQLVGSNKPLPAPPLFPAEQALILPANGQWYCQ